MKDKAFFKEGTKIRKKYSEVKDVEWKKFGRSNDFRMIESSKNFKKMRRVQKVLYTVILIIFSLILLMHLSWIPGLFYGRIVME